MTSLFFDLDGTLTDPKAGIIGSTHYALEKLGISDIPEDLDWVIGPPLRESFEVMVGPELADKGVEAYREHYSVTGLFDNEVYAGIPELLTELKAAGHPLYVATSKPHVFANPILERFELASYFDAVFGAELDGTRGNKADLLTYALEKTGAEAASSVMIGDRKHDILGGKANGMKTVSLLWGYGSREEFETAGTDKIVATLAELRAELL
ncbi:HAD hydrolase-like protein [uncultured Cohaesibacter sp.]|uniref:HAD hydrolase-like protein n=1 Tax=uncultured Cohaesibacter sp. TaxID=1002546 RepID=UPI002AA7FB10|nr:HAD hydrolase-like protein [uncultured Cohaesibacter sp.]